MQVFGLGGVMGRKKLEGHEIEERKVEQEVICFLIKKRLPEMTDGKIEAMLNISNHLQDGAVFRRIARGKQLVSPLKIDEMIRICGHENIFTYEEVTEEMRDFYRKRDNELLQVKLEEWKSQLSNMAMLSHEGDARLKDALVAELEKTINDVKGIKK
jgi:hypothetical protein